MCRATSQVSLSGNRKLDERGSQLFDGVSKVRTHSTSASKLERPSSPS